MERRSFFRWWISAGRAARNWVLDLVDTSACRKIILETLETEDRASRLNDECADGVCERVSVGRFGTPGIVGDDEILHSLLIKPTDFSNDAINLALLTHAQVRGMSVMRGSAPDHEMRKVVSKRLRDPSKQAFFGVALLPVSAVRKLHAETDGEKRKAGDRFFRVLDTDLPDLPNHAEIFVTKPLEHPTIKDKTTWRAERAELMKIMSSKVTPAAEFRQGRITS